MGSPISPPVADLFMVWFEEKALSKCIHKPSCWFRYIDDTFVIWPHGREKLDSFLYDLNSIHHAIKFTMEVEHNNCLPFLDVFIKRGKDGKLHHEVY